MSLYDSFKKPNHLPKGEQSLLEWIKSNLDPEIILMVAGNISNITAADKITALGAELVAIGKAAVGNPDWVNRINAGKPLIKAPYSFSHLSGNSFTTAAIEYMAGISGLVVEQLANTGTES